MILQALVEYYDRLAADPDSDIAPIGWVYKRIGWVVVLNAEGKPKVLKQTYEQKGKKREAKRFLVPEDNRSTNSITPRLLWDNAVYVFGIVRDSSKNPEKAAEKAKAFRERIAALGLKTLKPVETFLANNPAEALQALNEESWQALLKDTGALITFRIMGDDKPVCHREDVKAAYERVRAEEAANAGHRRCIVSGCQGPITQTSPEMSVPGWPDKCKLISFQKKQGYDSYGKTQGNNAPICEEVTFKYITALERLLAEESTNNVIMQEEVSRVSGQKQKKRRKSHRISVGSETLLFWASTDGVALEECVSELFEGQDDLSLDSSMNDPNEGTRKLQALYRSVRDGNRTPEDGEKRFYFLCLQPTSKVRLAVRLWVEQSVAEASRNLAAYFDDLRIVGQKEGAPIPLYLILRSLAPLGKLENLPPRSGGELLFAAIKGTRFPDSLAQSVLRRLKVEDVTPIRAALLKAWLTRIDSTERKPTIMLDETNDNPGYCLGRLFAVLEKVQKTATPNLNATIKDRFYATASANPAAVFGTLLRNNAFHVAKLEPWKQNYFKKLQGEICSHLADIPAHLNLMDQARFALGYYHQYQRKDLSTKKTTPSESTEQE